MREALVLVLVLVGCGNGREGPPRDSGVVVLPDGAVVSIDGGAGDDAGSAPGDGGAPGSDAGSASDAGAAAAYPFCRIQCTVAADCATAGAPLYDASHYACDAGLCRWTGCQDDAECQATFSRTDYACRDQGGLRTCVETCDAAGECGSGTAAFDGDNYACTGGVCQYTGCRDDAECAATFSSDRYACRRASLPDTGLPIPSATMNCVLRCTTRADCTTASAAFDADNYECSGDACVYTGCNADAECASSFSSTRYVCR